MIETLMSSYEHFQRESQVSESLDSSLKIMEQYITNYYSMTPNGFWFYKMLSSGTSIVDRFLGFGGLMDKATMDAGRNDLIKVGGKKIRNHILNGQEQVYQSASQIENFADSILHYALKSEDELLKENYHKFLEMLRKKPDAYEYYAVYNEIFMNDFRLLHHTKKLARQIKNGAAQWAVTHKKLVTKVAAREKLTRGIPELYALLRYINEIEKTLSTLQGIENQYRYDSRSSRTKGY